MSHDIYFVSQVPRVDWVLKWPGQVVIAGCQAYWAKGVEGALESKGIGDVYKDVMLPQLDDLRNLVRQDIPKIGRMTLAALIVIEVHARDVTHNMVELGVENINDFEWISQLRLVLSFCAYSDFGGKPVKGYINYRQTV